MATLDPDTSATIDAVAAEWVQGKKMFSAFEVSLAAKERGVQLRHRDLKDYVHEAVSKAAEGHQYSRTLMDVGAPTQAWVYHPIADSPYAYVPLARGGSEPRPKKKPVKLRAPRELRAGSALPGSNEDGVFGAGPDGSLRVPAELCGKAGITPGIGLVVESPLGGEGLVVRRASLMELADPSVSVEPGGALVLPMSVLAKASLDRLQGYSVEAKGEALSVTALDD